MTHLRGDHLVYKDHPRIAFRGAIDSLEAEIIVLQTITEKQHLHTLTEDLEEIIKTIRWLLRCEVSVSYTHLSFSPLQALNWEIRPLDSMRQPLRRRGSLR